jgi:DNA-binding NarL/FixJ family response regulator
MNTIRVLIAGDHTLVRAGIRAPLVATGEIDWRRV